MLGNLVMACATVKESRFGRITPSMKDTGSMTGLTAAAGSSTLMGMCMRASGETIKLMEMEFTQELMGQHIPDSGRKIDNMDTASKSGTMVLPTKESTFRDSSRDMESSFGLMARSTRVISKKTSWRASGR